MYILLPCSFPSTYYNWQKLECYIFQNEFANVNFSSIRRQFAIVQFTDSFVCSLSVLDLMYFFSIIIMFQWFKNHFTLKLSLVKVGSFFFHYHFAWDDWWYHVFLRACCFERKWWYFVCKLFFFFMLNKKKEKRFVHVCPFGWCPILFFEYREYNDVTFKVRTIKMFFFLR